MVRKLCPNCGRGALIGHYCPMCQEEAVSCPRCGNDRLSIKQAGPFLTMFRCPKCYLDIRRDAITRKVRIPGQVLH